MQIETIFLSFLSLCLTNQCYSSPVLLIRFLEDVQYTLHPWQILKFHILKFLTCQLDKVKHLEKQEGKWYGRVGTNNTCTIRNQI